MKAILVVVPLLVAACSPSSSNEVANTDADLVGTTDTNPPMMNDEAVNEIMVEMSESVPAEGRETLAIDADDLSSAVESNEFAAEKEYGGRNLIVTARVEAVTSQSGPDAAYGHAAVKIDTANHELMEANLLSTETDKATRIASGDNVKVACTGYELKYQRVMLKDCKLLD